jgi:hypothetical protein
MRKLMGVGVALLSLAFVVMGVAMAADGGGKPKHTIKEVMKNAHKDKLLNKVLGGEASQEQKLVLLDHYISLVECEPPKGDMDSWQNLAGRLALASAKVAVGREGALAELDKAKNCKVCHDAHK